MVHVHCVIMMTVLFLVKASVQCNHGEIRLMNGAVPNEGRVEVCACISISCSWGTVCDDSWGMKDAQVVCRQLGYKSNGSLAFNEARFGRGRGYIALDNVRCNASEMTLLECDHNGLFMHNCNHNEDAGVKCPGGVDSSLLSAESITNVSINTTTIISTHGTNFYTAFINWKLRNTSRYRYHPNSFLIECFSHQHHFEIYTTFSTHVMGLLPATTYNCCVSSVYEFYITRGVCIEKATIQPPTSLQPNTSRASADTIGGVLGFIIAILLILLAISGAALVYLLRQTFHGNVIPKVFVDRNSTDVPVGRNLSYAITPSHSTTSGPQTAQATRAAGQSETDAAADYSRIGPPYYETTDSRRQQPAVAITGRSQVSSRLSEKYEFSEAHLTIVGSDDGGQGKAAVDYEVSENLSARQISEEHEEYSHLQY